MLVTETVKGDCRNPEKKTDTQKLSVVVPAFSTTGFMDAMKLTISDSAQK